jgi:hypothetical protein
VKPAETIIPMGKGRSLIVILAAIAGVVLTLRLGGWQLSRADEKIQYQSQLEAQMRLPPLDTLSLQQNPEQWLNVHRRVELFGTWLSEKTVYLDNRSHKGRPVLGDDAVSMERWASGVGAARMGGSRPGRCDQSSADTDPYPASSA